MLNFRTSDTEQAKATFTAPSTTGEYVFKLTVTGPNVSSTSTTKVTIDGSQTAPEVTANAGPDQKISNKELSLHLMEADQKMLNPTHGNK